jgi:NAD+ synthase
MHRLTKDQIMTAVDLGAGHLYDYCKLHGIHFLVTGSSGGLDSAIKLGFAARACMLARADGYNLNSVGLILPCQSNPDAERLGRQAIKHFNAIEYKEDLTPLFEAMEPMLEASYARVYEIRRQVGLVPDNEIWEWDKRIAQGNIKARLRMLIGTYHVARLLGSGMVLSTDNLSEFWMAFWTLNGDVGDYAVIQKVLKGLELYDFARFLGVPEEIVNSKPDDGLSIAGGDEDQLGASYPVIDEIMIKLIQAGFDPDGSKDQLEQLPEIPGFMAADVLNVARRCLNGAFKRKGTVVLERADLGLPEIKDLAI